MRHHALGWTCLAAAMGLFTAACHGAGPVEPSEALGPSENNRPGQSMWMGSLPKRYEESRNDPIADAIQVWRLGAGYIPAPPEPEEDGTPTEPWAEPHLPVLGPSFRWFLADESPYLEPAVQFSDCPALPGEEEREARTAMGRDHAPETRLLGLVISVRVHAPASVAEQWATLRDLEALRGRRPDAGWLLDRLHREFEPASLEALLALDPPKDRYGHLYAREWAAMAAGVAGNEGALPRLVALATGPNLDSSLAAEAALEVLPGEPAERALTQCATGWRYDAWIRASQALLGRNPKLLEQALLGANVPEDCRTTVAFLLCRLGNPVGVTDLCEAAPGVLNWGRVGFTDADLFDLIERLATLDQQPAVETLPLRAREDQVSRAKEVVESVRRRFQEAPK